MTRLQDPAVRSRLPKEMLVVGGEWENLYMAASPVGIRLVGLVSEAITYLNGRTIAEAEHYESSKHMAEPDLLPRVRRADSNTPVVVVGFEYSR